MIKAIDAHHHFWDTSKGDYSWMTDAHAPINRVFDPTDLEPLLEPAGIVGTVLVQTWSSIEESLSFLETAASTDFVKGVVGWVDMTSPNVGKDLDRLLLSEHGTYLKGVRHQVHDEDDPNWLTRADVMSAFQQIQNRDLVYDLLIRPREIPASLSIVNAYPNIRFVIDHIAKPDIANDGFNEWSRLMLGFAEHRENVWCKLSGMVTDTEWSDWDSVDYTKYIDRVIEIFGVDRVMLGSDWPVCTLATDYLSTIKLVRDAIAERPYEDQVKILRTNAIDAYKLSVAK